MTDTIKKVIEAWLVCKSHTRSNPRFKNNVPTPDKLFCVININLIRPLPIAASRHQYILIAFKHLTKWVKASSYPSSTAKTTALFLLRHVSLRHGGPCVLFSGNGLNFRPQVAIKLPNLFSNKQRLKPPTIRLIMSFLKSQWYFDIHPPQVGILWIYWLDNIPWCRPNSL